jgi:hypothetical protein
MRRSHLGAGVPKAGEERILMLRVGIGGTSPYSCLGEVQTENAALKKSRETDLQVNF